MPAHPVAPDTFMYNEPKFIDSSSGMSAQKWKWLFGVTVVLLVLVIIILAVLLGQAQESSKLHVAPEVTCNCGPCQCHIPYTSPPEISEETTTTATLNTTGSSAPSLPTWPPPSKNPIGKYHHGAVASNNVLCSEIGRNVLMRGGNAVDAIVATAVCSGVMDPYSSGLGGGHFLTLYDSSQKACSVIDARETAPLTATETMYVNSSTESTLGWKAVGVPGELHGLWTAFRTKGSGLESITWKSLLQPTIDLLEQGHPVSSSLAEKLEANSKYVMEEDDLKSVFYNAEAERLHQAGDIIKRPILAETLRALANVTNPAELFYNGTMGQTIAKEFQEKGGLITAEDLQKYTSVMREPIVSDFLNSMKICGPPPPSSAAVVQSIVNTLAAHHTNENSTTFQQNVMDFHIFIEAMKFGFSERTKMGDISFDNASAELAQNITSKKHADWVKSKITDRAHEMDYYGGGYSKEDHGTLHISVMDKDGNAASMTSTINLPFGAKRRSPTLGIIWNNEMDDFSTPGVRNSFGYLPSPSNFIKPGKRPMSSMSPTIFFNTETGKAEVVVGAVGGSRLISSAAYVAARILLLGEDVKHAIDARRLHNPLVPHNTEYEEGFPTAYVEALKSMGHNMTHRKSAGSAARVIHRGRDGYLHASSDWRSGTESKTAGY